MKIQILTDEKYKIEGFKHYFLNTEGDVDLSDVLSNECEEILLGGSINKVPLERVKNFLNKVFSKVRKGGIVKLNFINPRLLSRALCRDSVTLEEFNSFIYSNKSLIDLTNLEVIVTNNGLAIETCKLNGIEYDVTISR